MTDNDTDSNPETLLHNEPLNSETEIPIRPSYKMPYSLSMDARIRNLQLSLESSKELIVKANSVLLWEKQWHPTAIIGGCTVIFMLLWLSNPNILTVISLLGLAITIGDYALPSITSALFKNELWTPKKQTKFENICVNIILYKTKLELWITTYYRMRLTNPKMYFSLTIIVLALLTWIGGTINNLFLAYIAITAILLLPGMISSGTLAKWTDSMQKICNDLIDNAKAKVGQGKKTE